MINITEMLDWAHKGEGHLHITGPRGSGKTSLAKAVAAVASWGDANFTDTRVLQSQFNGWLMSARVTVIELENMTPEHLLKINTWMFGETITIERRGLDNIDIPNDKRWILVGGDDAVGRFDGEVTEFSL